jgi:hypothetical protein
MQEGGPTDPRWGEGDRPHLRQRLLRGGAGLEGHPAWCTWGEGEQELRFHRHHLHHLGRWDREAGHLQDPELQPEGAGERDHEAGEAGRHPGRGAGGRQPEEGRDHPPHIGSTARGGQVRQGHLQPGP